MKRIALVLAVFVSLMLPSTPSFAEWMKAASSEGNVFYVDTKIRKHDGHIYFWALQDYLKPDKKTDALSIKVYREADCGKFRIRSLQLSTHEQPMGRGSPSVSGPVTDNRWKYPPPGSVSEDVLEKACELAN
jgi:hypothetical protein